MTAPEPQRARPARRGALLGAGVVLALAAAAPARALSLDRAALEQVFGEPVTTSATGSPQRASDAPVNMEIITQTDIRRSGAQSIPDVLAFVAGLDVRRYGIADAEVGMRGYNQPFNPRLLVLVDGRQVYQDDYGRVTWSALPVQLAEIRQIEVIRGPNSALYGFNAVSGVINIVTYDPLYDRVDTATVYGGTQNTAGLSAVGTARIPGKAGLRVAFGGFGARDFAAGGLPAGDAMARGSPGVATFDLDGRIVPAPGVVAYAQASLADSRLAEENFTATFDTAHTLTNSIRLGVDADTRLGLLSLSGYRNATDARIDNPVLVPDPGRFSTAVTVLQASDTVKLGLDHTVRVGLEYRDNALRSADFVAGTIGYHVYAASLMWNWALTPALSLTNAVRVDWLRLYDRGTPAFGTGLTAAEYDREQFVAPSFNSGLVWRVTGLDTVRLMGAQGLQAPSLVDFGFQAPAGTYGPVVVAGNPDLHPSVVRQIELDYDRALPGVRGAARLALYAQRTDDLISQPFATTPFIGPAGLPVLLAANVGYSQALGAEAELKGGTTSGWRWNLGYAFVATTDHTTLNRGAVASSPIDYAASVPRQVVTAGLGYSRDRWEVDLLGRWQSSYLDFATDSTGTALVPREIANDVTATARVGYRLSEHLTAAVTAQQLTASHLVTTAGPPTERRVIVSLTAGF